MLPNDQNLGLREIWNSKKPPDTYSARALQLNNEILKILLMTSRQIKYLTKSLQDFAVHFWDTDLSPQNSNQSQANREARLTMNFLEKPSCCFMI